MGKRGKGKSTKRNYRKSQYTPRHKKKVIKEMMNEGGFYEGMPGCTTEDDNRLMLKFLVTPEGKETTTIHAHPKLCKIAVQGALENPMIKGIIQAAVVDEIFTRKTPLNLLLRIAYKLRTKRDGKKVGTTKENKDTRSTLRVV